MLLVAWELTQTFGSFQDMAKHRQARHPFFYYAFLHDSRESRPQRCDSVDKEAGNRHLQEEVYLHS